MKKKFKFINIVLIAITLFISPITVHAASANVSISGPRTVAPGELFTVTMSYSGPENILWEGFIKSSNGSYKEFTDYNNYEGRKSGSQSLNITINTPGEYTISGSINGSYGYDSEEPYNGSSSYVVNVVVPVTPPPTEKPNPTPTPDPKPIPPVKTPEQIAKEKEAAEEKEKVDKEAEELSAKELLEKTPLIASIEVVSMSSKKYNQSLNLFISEFDTWSYEYGLPSRVDKFKLSVLGVDNDVVLTFDEEHEFAEGDADSKAISIRAVKDDIVQEYTLTVLKDLSTPTTIDLNGVEVTAFVDEELDSFMTDSGFVRNTYKNKVDQDVVFFTLGNVNVQLIVNEKQEARWHLLSKENVIGEAIAIQFDVDKNPIFILDAPEEIAGNSLLGNKYKVVTGKVDDILLNLDDSIKWTNDYKAWSVDKSEFVYGMMSDGVRDTFKRDGEVIKVSFISFDNAGSSLLPITIATSVGFIAMSGYVLVTTLMNLRKRKNS